jgi:hypothetical protein
MFSGIAWFFIELFRVGFEYLGKILFILFNAVFVTLDKLTFSILSDTFFNKKAVGRNSFRDNLKLTKEKIEQAKKKQLSASKKDVNLRLVKTSKIDKDISSSQGKPEIKKSKSTSQKQHKSKKVVPIMKKVPVGFIKVLFKIIFSPVLLVFKMLKSIFSFIIKRLQPVEEENSKIGRKCLVEEYMKEYERKNRYFS